MPFPNSAEGSFAMNICNRDIRIAGRMIRTAKIDGEKYTFPDDPEAMISAIRNCGRRVDLFTFLQRLPETTPKYSYPMEWDNLAVLPVSTFEHWWTCQIRSEVRNRSRQAEKKGVTFREVPFGDELLQGICEIYNESPVRLGKRFPHYGMTMERARAYAGTFLEQSVYVGAFFQEKMIGFFKLVADESGTQACLIHFLSMLRHRDKAPANALIAQAVRICAERKIPYLVYEHFLYGKKPADSLSRFKEINGFQKVDLPRYYVPITPLGRMALKLGLHHRLVDRLPLAVSGKARELRQAWYARKIQAGA
jgi:hypothetical protein